MFGMDGTIKFDTTIEMKTDWFDSSVDEFEKSFNLTEKGKKE